MTVDSIDSSALFAPGPILGTQGLDSVSIGDDGTALTGDDLGPGDSYVIHAYAPDPSAAAMRRADDRHPGGLLRYTRFDVPNGEGYTATPAGAVESTTTVTLDSDADRRAAAQRLVLDSPYARTYRLARRLAGPAPTTYDAVRRIEEYLRSTYQYGEKPPERPHPLAAFLLRDRIGYCQQFSGAMALMLRMNGIPRASRRDSHPVRATGPRGWCGTSMPTRGSRCTSMGSAGFRSIPPRRHPRPRRSRAAVPR